MRAAEGRASSTTSLAINSGPYLSQYPLAYFDFSIGTRAGDIIRYVYIYESVGRSGGSNGGGNNGGTSWGPTNNNAGLNGTTLTYYRGTTAEQCQADCGKNPKCKAFTLIRAGAYSPNDPPMCYLMSEATGFAPSPCCISAIKNAGYNSIFSIDREKPIASLLTDLPMRMSKWLGAARNTDDSMILTKKVMRDDFGGSDY